MIAPSQHHAVYIHFCSRSHPHLVVGCPRTKSLRCPRLTIMASTRYSLIFPFITIFILRYAASAPDGFTRDECLIIVQEALNDGNITSNSSIFFRDITGLPMSSIERPVLTIGGCEQVCGKGFSWYKDIGPRLNTWLIPIFLLLTNLEVSPLDKRRYLMIAHLLGDPIDSLWSLLTKIEAWSRCRSMAGRLSRHDEQHTRNLATVLGGLEELCGFYLDPYVVYRNIIAGSNLTVLEINRHLGRAAQKLADSRTDERLRTILATVLYFYQLVSSFISTVGGGNTSPPGGRIGITMFMTWIIPSILISNAVGCFTSRRTCFDILEDFTRRVRSDTNLWTELQFEVPDLQRHKTVESFFCSSSHSGAIYTYRPSKWLPFTGHKSDRSPYLLLLLAMTPVLISSIVASVIIWHVPPIGINCRNLLIFTIVVFILLSTIITQALTRLGFSGTLHWNCMIAKDICLAVPSVVLVFLATSGRFNSCYCWSGVYTLGSKARIPLNTFQDFELFDKTTYPILVSICLSLLIAAFAAMMWVGWRGWNIMRWSERERQEEWSRGRLAIAHD